MDVVDSLVAQWREQRPDLDVSALGIAVRIETLAKLMQREIAANLVALGLKTWEYDVMSALRRQGRPFILPVSALAKASLLTPGAMTTRIDRLAAKRLVERHADPKDRRGVNVGLTSKGLLLVDRAIETRLHAADSAIANLTNKDKQATERLLQALLNSLDA